MRLRGYDRPRDVNMMGVSLASNENGGIRPDRRFGISRRLRGLGCVRRYDLWRGGACKASNAVSGTRRNRRHPCNYKRGVFESIVCHG